MESVPVLIAFAGGLVAALALHFGGGLLYRRRRRQIEERRRAGELPANDNRGRRRPIGYERAKDVAAQQMADRLRR